MKVLKENGSLGKLKGWKKETALKAKRLFDGVSSYLLLGEERDGLY